MLGALDGIRMKFAIFVILVAVSRGECRVEPAKSSFRRMTEELTQGPKLALVSLRHLPHVAVAAEIRLGERQSFSALAKIIARGLVTLFSLDRLKSPERKVWLGRSLCASIRC